MSSSRGFRRRFHLRSRDAAEEMEEEIRTHVALRAAELERQGLSSADAEAQARRHFGDFAEARRRLRASAEARDRMRQRRERWGSLRRDLVFALRQMRRARGFTALVVLTFALGIGATTAVFTLVDHALLRPLPYPNADRLVVLQSVGENGEPFSMVSAANWWDWREQNRTLADIALVGSFASPVAVAGPDRAVQVQAVSATGNFFDVLAAPMLVGRPFTEAEIQEGAELAVVSEGYWQRELGAPQRLDIPVRIGQRTFRIVGVVRAEEALPATADIWLGFRHVQRTGAARNWINWLAVARLAPGRSIVEARADLDAIAAGIREADPAGIYSFGVGVRPLRDEILGDAPSLLALLLAAVGLVLLIVCANVASANLARGAGRSRELAVRAALGAGRARLAQQLLVEQVTLAVAGGVLGLALAWWLIRGLVLLGGERIPRLQLATMDLRVLAAALLIALLAGTLSGLIPALRLSRTSLTSHMARGGRGGGAGIRPAAGLALVGGEVALALVLLTGAGLLIRSMQTLVSRDLGFTADQVVTVDVNLGSSSYAGDSLRYPVLWDAVIERLGSVPGVQSAGAADRIPLSIAGTGFIDLPGRFGDDIGAGYRVVSDDYFRALGVPLLAGRAFEASDDRASERVVLVNRTMAERYWPGESPIGRQVRARSFESSPGAPEAPWLTVVGVVGDMRHFGYAAAPRPEMYTLYRQVPGRAGGVTAVVRTSLPYSAVTGVIRERLRDIDAQLAVEVGTLDEAVDRSLAPHRFPMTVLTGFGVLALVLAAVGLYGVLSVTVAQRTRELAVRSALGAERGRLLRLVLAQAGRPLVAGTAVGLLAAWYLSRYLGELLVETSATDAAAFGVATAGLLAVGLLAAIIPARRAMRIDPMVALRNE